ncbi:MAG: hypothetical protein HOB70_00725 [Chloroflexi bacterium]|nr:hypothetical protein [Chloroflexota bacterium]
MNNVSFLAFSASFGLICNIVLGSGLGGQVISPIAVSKQIGYSKYGYREKLSTF